VARSRGFRDEPGAHEVNWARAWRVAGDLCSAGAEQGRVRGKRESRERNRGLTDSKSNFSQKFLLKHGKL